MIPQVCGSLDEALKSLEQDSEFLTKGGVFSEEFINAYIALLKGDIDKLHKIPHPAEFELYYSL